MEANDFIAEIYRRIDVQLPSQLNKSTRIAYDIFINDDNSKIAYHQYAQLLPKKKEAKILDIGFGSGWFMSACIKLGYTNIYGMDFNANEKMLDVIQANNKIKGVFNIKENIADTLMQTNIKFDFIHLSHVIEHIPKYSLLYIVDAIYASLNKGGVVLLRTPNMEGPLALSSLFITLGHEYGFSASNINFLLTICGFENIKYYDFPLHKPTVKQRFGNILRNIYIFITKCKYRLFGAVGGRYYGQLWPELIVTGIRGDRPELFNKNFR